MGIGIADKQERSAGLCTGLDLHYVENESTTSRDETGTCNCILSAFWAGCVVYSWRWGDVRRFERNSYASKAQSDLGCTQRRRCAYLAERNWLSRELRLVH